MNHTRALSLLVTKPRPGEIVLGGAGAGLVAGAGMALVAAISTGAEGESPAVLLEEVAAAWLGVGALVGGPGAVVLGTVTHLLVSSAWGVALSLLVRHDTSAVAASLLGLLWGATVWLVMTFGVMPAVDPVMYVRVQLSPWPWVLAHAAFGVLLGTAPAAQRAAARALQRPPKAPRLVLVSRR